MKKLSANILLSVFPEYVDRILSGEKRFEFRKHIPVEVVDHIVFYATAPVAKILCIAKVDSIISGTPSSLWNTTALFTGVDKNFYNLYYKNVKTAYAYKLGEIYSLETPLSLHDEKIRTSPPQTFRYLTPEQFEYIRAKAEIVSSNFRRNIFLGGIHAVGKTTFVSKHFSKKYKIVTASQLIQRGGEKIYKCKQTNNINKKQQILISEFHKLKTKKKHIVLDGHFCLLNKNGKIKMLDINLFRALGISHIIILETHPKVIKERLMRRDGTKMKLSFIKRFIEIERTHALHVAEDMKIPITIIPDTRFSDDIILDR